jgi:hypothetical protein
MSTMREDTRPEVQVQINSTGYPDADVIEIVITGTDGVARDKVRTAIVMAMESVTKP